MSSTIGNCPRCYSEMMARQARKHKGYCSSDCELDDMDLALKHFVQQTIKPDAIIDWDWFENRVKDILSGNFEKPWRPYTVYR